MDEKLTLTELQLTIRDSLYIALPDWYWVIAEISEIKELFRSLLSRTMKSIPKKMM